MVIRTIANKVGTIEIDGNSFFFLQPLSSFRTDELELIHQAYERRMTDLRENEQYLAARDITFQSGQVQFEFDVSDLKAFDHLKSLYLKEKLPYYLSLISIAQNNKVDVLWQKENFVLDTKTKEVKAAVIGNGVLELHNQKNQVDSIKELIIISLTHLNRVLGRPKRSDFFEQEEKVIRFAEMIYLRLNTLEELASYISKVYKEVQEEQQLEAEWLAQQEQEKKRFRLPKGFPFTADGSGNQNNQRPNYEEKKKAKKESGKGAKEGNLRLFVGSGILLVVALLINLMLTNANEEAQAIDPEPQSASLAIELDLEDIYRQGLLGDRETVITALEEVGYNSLAAKDQDVLISLYRNTGEYLKVIEHRPQLAGEIAAELAVEGQVDELKVLQESLPEPDPDVDFELAAATENWRDVLTYRNRVKLTERRRSNVVTAFIRTDDLQGAKAFVSEEATGNEKLLSRILDVEKLNAELAALEKERASQQSLIKKNEDEKKVTAAKERIKEIDARIQVINESIENG